MNSKSVVQIKKIRMYKIAIIGYGNLGFHLVNHLSEAGHIITQVFTRDKSKTRISKYKIDFIDDLNLLNSDADVYFIPVKDDALNEVARLLSLRGKIVAHCSASVEMTVLKNSTENFGVFYPLQTFSREVEVDFKNIPILIEGVNKKTISVLKEIASSLSDEVIEVNQQQRLAVHVAAVFANNFSNYLFSVAEEILKKENISYKILLPLIEETVRKVKEHAPSKSQTGPAKREDDKTIQKHLKFLSNKKELKNLYSIITEQIKSKK